MNKKCKLFFLYQKDFSERGNDRYFVYENDFFSEVNSDYIVSIESPIVTHDYWLIMSSLYKKEGKLPPNVIDITLLSRIVYGIKAKFKSTQPWDISKTINILYQDKEDFKHYMNMYYRRELLDMDTYMLFSHKLAEYTDGILTRAAEIGELNRFYDLELPVFNMLSNVVCRGIKLSQDVLRTHKINSKYEYYRALKDFAEKHDVLYELPSEGDIKDKLRLLGYDVDNYNIDFLINFLPSPDGYTADLTKLQKVYKSYRVLNSISVTSKRLSPMVESHSTSTSRIYYKSPAVQNLSKKYRNIFVPDEGMRFSYVDYDQFEVGIMAALSGDKKLLEIYTNRDAYTDLSNEIFSSDEYRKKCKIYFLSYTYGMAIKNILASVHKHRGNKTKCKAYFKQFSAFEQWKETLYSTFKEQNRIATIHGNYLNRTKEGELTNKEKRGVVSHVVQGTGSYIFKSALLKLSNETNVSVLIPMHDAILIQHPVHYDPSRVVRIMQDTMTEILKHKIKGKASIEEFYIPV